MRITHSLLTALLFVITLPLFSQNPLWTVLDENSLTGRTQERWVVPEKYATLSLDAASMWSMLDRVLAELIWLNPASAVVFRSFVAEEADEDASEDVASAPRAA